MPTEPNLRAHGALLAAGDRSALAGSTAGALYGCATAWEPFELISSQQKRTAGLNVHRSSTLRPQDIWIRDGLRVTSPARTALDLAERADPDHLHKIVDHLRLRHGLKLSALVDVITRNPRHTGAAPLRKLLRVLAKNATRSGLERHRWPDFAERFGIGPYEQNVHVVPEYESDVLVDGLIIVELDTVETHLLNFESDRHRDADILARTGIPTIRVLDTDLADDPEVAARRILDSLDRRRAETARPRAA